MYLKQAFVVACCIGCAPAYADEVYKAVDTDEAHSYWIPQKTAHAGRLFPESAMRKHMDVCVAVAFTVEADGATKNVQVIRTETSKPEDSEETARLASAASASVARMHYNPASENQSHQPIFTYVAVSMAAANSGTTAAVIQKHAKEVAQSCSVQDFVASANAHKIVPTKQRPSS